MDAMTLKMDTQYKELQSKAKKTKPYLDEDEIPMSREEEAKFMPTFVRLIFTMITATETQIAIIGVQTNEVVITETITNPIPINQTYDLTQQLNNFMKSQQSTNAFVKETFMDLKTQLETVAKNHQASIQNLETKFDRLADKQSGRPSGSLPSNTQPNPKGHNSKTYQPPQSRNEHVNAVFTRSGKSYNQPVNPNNQQDNSKTPVNFDSDDEEDEPTPQPKTQNPKQTKETPLPKPYKPKIPYPQRLRKEKMEAQYGKFLDIIRSVRINVPLIDVLAGMPNYGKFLKELISNKHKIEQISAAFLSDESSAMIQNKVPPKLGDPGSFLIPCNFNKTFSCNALADLGASINLMPYSLYAKLSLETLKPTKMSVRLAEDIQYPVGIAENKLVEVEFDIEIKDRKGTINVAVEHLSQIENDETSDDIEVDDNFTRETLMEINTKDEPWFADFANYLVDVIASSNPTPGYDPIVSNSSPTLTPFRDSDFLLLEEADAFLALADDPTSSEVNESYYDLEGDILILETLLNSDPSPPPNQGNYLPKIRKELNTVEAKLLANSQLMKSSPPRSNLRTYRLISNMHFWKTTTSCQS
ncbi:reverse transcriptase domain-containing protein [Tanacetum coccineum]